MLKKDHVFLFQEKEIFLLILLSTLDPPCQLNHFLSRFSSNDLLFLLSAIDAPTRHTRGISTAVYSVLLEVMSLPPSTLMTSHFYMFADDGPNEYNGRDVFSRLSQRRRDFYFAAGETPETFLEMYANVNHDLQPPVRNRPPTSINRRNRLLLTLMWLRSYPSYTMLSIMFDVSVSTPVNARS